MVKPFREFLPENMWARYRPGLQATYNKITADGVWIPPTPDDLLSRLDDFPEEERPYCRAHDDLNLRNVFICDGHREAVLIDFTRAARRPLSHDCARLDVGLAFDVELNAGQPLETDVLENFYTGDLFSISLEHTLRGGPAVKRLSAISAIRTQLLEDARAAKFDPRQEYRIAIAAELLYHARSQGPFGELAYKCAASLSDAL
jgi:hypothetical protein